MGGCSCKLRNVQNLHVTPLECDLYFQILRLILKAQIGGSNGRDRDHMQLKNELIATLWKARGTERCRNCMGVQLG
jgi:hypothetical protein